ncbi:hypothetical protein NUU98_17955 [Cronobacter sakazakii]|uniref:hypothetical protein n=1 Tax=Cronobacter sakazakii TaxID=28141 RepID=UPI0009B1ECD9|nr:hypothetical protein [Cronobacter sakazakii]MDQ1933498.1 hypothetical protein [Cronobacter sakazakii]MDQ1937912.1 hypothetical protein [Cronobacter sakazakii]MDQ1942001.1 hypothetical protein [Cronobacter sakazakii]MDQ1946262.1 hypothetical protein [Cronobacter sakazakii]MDQ1950464.1 hypothetical protein [Cronobacter sakazakii]
MSEISQEALAVACADKVRQLEFSVKQSAFDSVRQELETELAIARVALLAMRERAEPVAWTDEQELRDAKKSGVGYLFGMGAEANKFVDPHRKMMLYTAPPAPVVAEPVSQPYKLPGKEE